MKDEKTTYEKDEKPVKINMSFDEAMERLSKVKISEVEQQIKESKEKD